jgi:RNA polymerase sigma-70 factor (ECF subfamily)
MAAYGQVFSRQRDAIHKSMPRLYKFALVLTANEELARGLLRGTIRAMHIRNEWQDEDASRLTAGFRRMYALWSAKLDEDPALQKKCPPDPRLFAAVFTKGSLAGNAQFARFIATLPAAQRGVLYLVYGEGASYDEAAEVAALNMHVLMNLLAQGHSALTKWLDQRGAVDGGDPYLHRERAA